MYGAILGDIIGSPNLTEAIRQKILNCFHGDVVLQMIL